MQMGGSPFEKCIHGQLGKENKTRNASAIQYLQSLRCSPESSIWWWCGCWRKSSNRMPARIRCKTAESVPSKHAFPKFSWKGRE